MRSSPIPADANIGARIKLHRLGKEMTQVELARAIGVSVQQLQKYEGGLNRIAAPRLLSVATALGTTTGDLLGEAGGGRDEASPLLVPGAAELLRAYAAIPDPAQRRGLLAMARALVPGADPS
ncbi:helix-turn-helix domain-containing protein [Brevundimonas sp. GCM10030266]|uniref:helix-turn-helix domain-containing protein n=1 Tax=Brevundimonas sp. GCM10030266 TaxID=3273386 RepID=UPI00360FB50B